MHPPFLFVLSVGLSAILSPISINRFPLSSPSSVRLSVSISIPSLSFSSVKQVPSVGLHLLSPISLPFTPRSHPHLGLSVCLPSPSLPL
ncbi:hypothetical protein RRG08_003015 [Elysia crispata]|uniref:Secreted protein n=1 Tax=Elysia crispata TaxID=231223 RepID=A0AAE0ZWV1_9GAST|nr:hypothetical protein RRG08_003015 [Elysia crispata]